MRRNRSFEPIALDGSAAQPRGVLVISLLRQVIILERPPRAIGHLSDMRTFLPSDEKRVS
jgi:hypothetical protein